MPLIYGNDVSTPVPLSRLTWVALVSDAVLLAYWAFMLWTETTRDLPDFLRGESGYGLFASIAVAFAVSAVTAIVAIAGLRARNKRAPGARNTAGVAVLVVSLLLNPVLVLPVLYGLVG